MKVGLIIKYAAADAADAAADAAADDVMDDIKNNQAESEIKLSNFNYFSLGI